MIRTVQSKTLRWFFLAPLLAVLVLALVLVVHGLGRSPQKIDLAPHPGAPVDEALVAEHLGRVVQLRTFSSPAGDTDPAPFLALHRLLEQFYPHVHARARREVIGERNLLFTIEGSDPNLAPALLLAHQDVVPIAPGTEDRWEQPPWSGTIAGGFVWGRGAWDDKGNLITQLEALESLLAGGFVPQRTILLAYGADEEVSGEHGARAIATVLRQRGIRPQFALDEGLLVTDGLLPGVKRPVALIGVAEKGYLSVQLKATATPGHSSMPPAPGQSAIPRITHALCNLDTHPMPGSIQGVARQMFETVAPEMPFASRIALGNLWLLEPVVRAQLEGQPSTNAMLRTTTAMTVMRAGERENVLPGSAEAIVNFRILPGEDHETVMRHVREQVAGLDVQASELPGGSEPSAVSPTDNEAYRAIEAATHEVFADTVVAPGLMIGGTDSRHYADVARSIYRFSPVRAHPEDLDRFHGTNERVSLQNLGEMVRFYRRLLERTAGPAVVQ